MVVLCVLFPLALVVEVFEISLLSAVLVADLLALAELVSVLFPLPPMMLGVCEFEQVASF